MSRGPWRHRKEPLDRDHRDLIDPAAGEAVRRCRICGMPDRKRAKLLIGTWTYLGYSLELVLCEREVPPFDPRHGDPLTVEEAA